MRDLIVGLDLGTYAFRMVAARPDPASPDGVEILGAASVPARGIRRGAVVSLDDTIKAIGTLRRELERRIGQPIDDAIVGIGGPSVSSVMSRGLVVVSRPDSRIGEDDIRRVLEAAGAVSLANNDTVLDIIPREYFVDNEGGIKNVEGMQGRRLETEAVVLTVQEPHLKNVQHALHGSDLDPTRMFVNIVATAKATLPSRPRELGVALIDIGHGTTDLAIYEEGDLLAASVIPIGGSHITNDIAIGMRCSIDAAERAKHEHGTADAASVQKRDMINLGTLDPAMEGMQFSRRELAEIIEARLEEIFELVGAELRKFERWRLLPAGIVLTGGTANIPGVLEVARRSFSLPVQLGYPTIMEGPDNVTSRFDYTTAMGLTMLAAEGKGRRSRRKLPKIGLPSMPRLPAGDRFRKIFKSLLP
jgi:cell division protein FtsA